MRIKYIIILLIFFCGYNSNVLHAQFFFKGKEIHNHLILVDQYLKDGKIDKAISIFKDSICSYKEKHVKRKDKSLYEQVSVNINRYIYEREYSSEKLKSWDSLFSNRDYEKLNDLFVYDRPIAFFDTKDTVDYIEMNNFLTSWSENYNKIYNEYVDSASYKATESCVHVSYKNLLKSLNQTKRLQVIYDLIPMPDGNTPLLSEKILNIKDSLSKSVLAQQDYIEQYVAKYRKKTSSSPSYVFNTSNRVVCNGGNVYFIVSFPNGKTFKISSGKMCYILNNDVISYYNLDKIYADKKHLYEYMKSSDYLEKCEELANIRSVVVQKSYYVILDSSYFSWDKNFLKIESKTYDGFLFDENFFQLEDLALTPPITALVKNSISEQGLNYFHKQSCNLQCSSIKYEELKKIEQSKFTKVLWVFKLNRGEINRNKLGDSRYSFTSSFVIGDTQSVLLYNAQNNRSYCKWEY